MTAARSRSLRPPPSLEGEREILWPPHRETTPSGTLPRHKPTQFLCMHNSPCLLLQLLIYFTIIFHRPRTTTYSIRFFILRRRYLLSRDVQRRNSPGLHARDASSQQTRRARSTSTSSSKLCGHLPHKSSTCLRHCKRNQEASQNFSTLRRC